MKIKTKLLGRIMSIALSMMIALFILPVSIVSNVAALGLAEPNFIIKCYDSVMRFKMEEEINDKDNYKIYISTTPGLGLDDLSGSASCVFNSDVYVPATYAYNGMADVLNSSNTVSIAASTTYYVYFVTNNTDLLEFIDIETMPNDEATWLTGEGCDTTWYTGPSEDYSINNEDELAGLAYLVNNGTSFDGTTIYLQNDLNMEYYRWIPIGTPEHPFNGMFYSNDHTISGIVINNTDLSYCGLFGYTNRATVSNITCNDGFIVSNDEAGGIVGYGSASYVRNCHNFNTVISTGDYVAGICADGDSDIKNCTNAGDIKGANNAGGICGYLGTMTEIKNCINSGDISASGDYCGGIVGEIVGELNDCDIVNCVNTGTVNGQQYTGGIEGSGTETDVVNCYNTGLVTGSTNVGGIAGRKTDGTILNCYYTGNSIGIGGADAPQDGVTKFTSTINKETIEVGETATLTYTTPVWDTTDSANPLGADFAVTCSYSSSLASISGTTVTGTSQGTGNIIGTMSITQNAPASDGFTGATRVINVSLSTPLTVTVQASSDDTSSNITPSSSNNTTSGDTTGTKTIPQKITDSLNEANPSPIELMSKSNSDFSSIKANVDFSKLTDTQKTALKNMTEAEIEAELKTITDAISTINTEKLSEKAKDKIEKVKNTLPSDAKIMPINFTAHAEFAFPVDVTVQVDKTTYPAGTYYLYYYNEETDKVEDCGTVTVDANGVATFTISHCSDYFMSSKTVDIATANTTELVETTANPKTGENNSVKNLLIIAVLLISNYVLVSKRRKFR